METDKFQKSHEYYIDLARTSPKVSEDEMTEKEKVQGHNQFGNNFYLLFIARLERERDPNNHTELEKVYLDNMEARYSEHWQRFLSKNTELIEKIDLGIAGLAPYQQLWRHYRDLLRGRVTDGNMDLDNDFEALGSEIEAVGIQAWRELNPNLEKAAEQMRLEGINPEEFFS